MKIAIAELETPTEIIDLNYEMGGAIVGGEATAGTFGGTSIELGAFGEFTFTDADTFSVTLDTQELFGIPGSATITGGIGVSLAFE